MIHWQRGPRQGVGKDDTRYPNHWTAWEGERHIGSVIECDGRWSVHLRKPGGGWLDGPGTLSSAEVAKQALEAVVGCGGAA